MSEPLQLEDEKDDEAAAGGVRLLAQRRSMLRELNERIRELGWGPSGTIDVVCECGDTDCWRGVTLTAAEYESVRSSAICFAVIPGHELMPIERVLERHPHFVVVQNLGEAADVARATDPRAAR